MAQCGRRLQFRLVGNVHGYSHVAGGLALLWQAKPSLIGNIDQSELKMEQTAQHLTDIQASGYCRGPSFLQDNSFGCGLLNLLRAGQ